MKRLLSFFIMTLATLFNNSILLAGGNPQITAASAAFVDSGANIRVQWQAEEPITRVMISIGSERKVIDVDIRDNSRTPSGVGGEASAVVPVMQGGGAASIQIEDEYRRKSEIVTIAITGQQRQTQSFGFPQGGGQQSMPAQDDAWGKENLARHKPQLPELKAGQGQAGILGTAGIPTQPQDSGMVIQQQPQGVMPQIQGAVMPPPMPMTQPAINIPPPMPNQGIAPPPPIPAPQNIPGMAPPPPPPPMPMDPGMIPPPPPPM